jgi:hypothetical protein
VTASAGDNAAYQFASVAEAAVAGGTPEAVSDEALAALLTATIRLYAAKSEQAGAPPRPFAENSVTATEAVVLACAVIRTAGLNLFDVAMWFSRPAGGL